MSLTNASFTPYSMQELCDMTHGMPLSSAQAMSYSCNNMHQYLDQHVNEALALDSDKAALMAAGRLGWLLQRIRPSLSALFTEAELELLLNCFRGGLFFPAQLHCIASDLCDDLGVELSRYKASDIAALVDKVKALTDAQRLTLADALEQAWHRGVQCNRAPKEVLRELGIELADACVTLEMNPVRAVSSLEAK